MDPTTKVKEKLTRGELQALPNTSGKSDVWKQMDIITTVTDEQAAVGYAQCRQCKHLFKYDSKLTGTSHLSRHLDKGCTGQASSAVQLSVAGYVTTKANQPLPVPASAKANVTQKCVEFCCEDIRSFQTVAGLGFQKLAQELINTGATYGRVSAQTLLPDPTTVSRNCHKKATEKRDTLVGEIKEVMSEIQVGMTTDMWTDDYRKVSYMTITCHYVMPDFQIKSKVLSTPMFPQEDSKTGANICRELQKNLVTVLKFDPSVMSKVVWVTDQGSNIICALRQYRRLDCQDHVYNTVLKHALDINELSKIAPAVCNTLQAVKKVVKYAKQSGLASQLSKTVLQMGDTRFSTVYLTLKSIQDVYGELVEKLESRGEGQKMTDVSPDIVNFLVSFLERFYDAQREMEGELYPTLNLVVLWHGRLKSHCQPVSTDLPYQARIRERHLEWIGKKIEIRPQHKLAMFLWPKYNQLRMFSDTERDVIHQDAKSWMATFRDQGGQPMPAVPTDTQDGQEEPPAAKKRHMADFEREWENVSTGDNTTDVDEIQVYLNINDSMSEDDRDLLGWWKKHQGTLPCLARLARQVRNHSIL